MARIGIIAPDMRLFQSISPIAAELGLAGSLTMHCATMEEGLDIARAMEKDGVDVIVSRGATVELLADSGIRVPVVSIPINIQDLANALRRARDITGLTRPRIAFVTYPRIDWDLKAFSSLLDMDLHIYPTGLTRAAVVSAAHRALAEGADVAVGGPTSEQTLRGRMPFILYESEPVSLRQALLEAKKIAYARELEQTQAQMFRAVVNISNDAFLSLDSDGRIRLANPKACQILGLPPGIEGRLARELISAPALFACMEEGQRMDNELLHIEGQSVLASAVPTVVGGKTTGAVISFQPTTQIEALEARIRRSRVKGFVAKHFFTDIAGISPQISAVRLLAERYAARGGPVLLQGETGTGKELFAQAVHNASARRRGPFVAVNCAALPPSLLESEFFGYEEGAFTGAQRKGKPGLFELAHQGTIFLDEIAAMDHYGQTRLLRVLQEKSVMRLGGDKYTPVDFMVIAASNSSLWTKVTQGQFREDLYYRLHVLPLTLPPLREREGDITHLAGLFMRGEPSSGGGAILSGRVLRLLEEHNWPGNVRELKHCIRRLCLLCDSGPVSPEQVETALALPQSRETASRTLPCPAAGEDDPVRRAECRQILDALDASDGNQRKAAELLGVDKGTLYRRMRRLGIKKTKLYQP